MKKKTQLLAFFAAICLLAGCAANTGQTSESDLPETVKTENPAEARTEAPASAGTETAIGEPEGWEEDWPEEYPVTEYRLSDGAIRQTGRLNKYRYTQLAGAETYMDLVADYVRQALGCGDELTMQEDSPHDGYANWFMEAPNGSASVSGSSITGRFSFGLYPSFNRILEMTEQVVADRDAMEQAAWAFAERFSGVTGELVLRNAEEDLQYYHDERTNELKDITVPALKFTFCSASRSELTLEIQEGLPAPVACGDSTIEDMNVHCFTVTVWPDGTVVRADNYITQAQTVPDGTVRMPDESDLPALLSYLTSLTENDTLVIEQIRAGSFNVYFGAAEVEPIVTVRYHFESDPTETLSTEFSMGLFGED